MIFEPMDFIARLASLVPKPRVHLARFHGVFAPNSKYRSLITKVSKQKQKCDAKDLMTEGEGKARQSWARRLARVFNIDITICSHCQGKVKVIACIEEPDLIKKILNHIDYQPLKNINENEPLNMRAPPAFSLG